MKIEERNGKNITYVLFGATGDLARRKLISALFEIARSGKINISCLGVGRRNVSPADWRKTVRESLAREKASKRSVIDKFVDNFLYLSGDFEKKELYSSIKETLEGKKGESAKDQGTKTLFHLALPPSIYKSAIRGLSKSGLIGKLGEFSPSKLLVEKPFGNDLRDTKKISRMLKDAINSENVFRIDHYLAKQSVRDIFNARIANPKLERVLSSKFVKKISVEVNEKIDVSKRADSYDALGALRDVGQNHLLQLIAAITMEIPNNQSATAFQNAREVALKNLRPKLGTGVCLQNLRGQYIGYESEEGVNPRTDTETFFSITAKLSSKRWKGTKFELTSGKALADSYAKISVFFKKDYIECGDDPLEFHIQPDPRIIIPKNLLRGGKKMSVPLNSKYVTVFANPYAEIIYDAWRGDKRFSVSDKEAIFQWKFVTEILRAWKNCDLVRYEKGTYPHSE